MKKTLTILGFLAAFQVGIAPGTAFADDDCFVPMANWQPRDAVAKLAEDKGWAVRRIKIDDGCYEIDGKDETGRRIEVKLHPATLEVIEIEYEEQEEEKERRRKEGEEQSDD